MSNCFLMALLNRFKGCPIYYVKPYRKDGMPHFVWYDKKLKCYRHYTDKERHNKKWWEFIIYKGYIDNFPYDRLKIKLIRLL